MRSCWPESRVLASPLMRSCMRPSMRPLMRRLLASCSVSIVVLSVVSLAAASSDDKLHFNPRFIPGETLRYRIETHTSSNGHTVTPIVNPQGASRYEQSTSLILRLDALAVEPEAASSEGAVRFRATFELATSDSLANGYAPQSAKLDDAVENLKGKSFEFSVAPPDKLADVQGLGKITPDRDVAARILSWIHVLFAPVELPPGGIQIGQKWTSERTLTDLPLTGVVWRNESRYLRDESCAASSGIKAALSTRSMGDCAVLLTQFNIARRGSEHSDATPEAYIHNGLRTSGKWTGSGESLDSISLSRGLLVSSTQTATQDMDYEIRSASTNSRIRHTGRTTTQTEITLLEATSPKS